MSVHQHSYCWLHFSKDSECNTLSCYKDSECNTLSHYKDSERNTLSRYTMMGPLQHGNKLQQTFIPRGRLSDNCQQSLPTSLLNLQNHTHSLTCSHIAHYTLSIFTCTDYQHLSNYNRTCTFLQLTTLCTVQSTGGKISHKSRIHLKIPGARMVPPPTFHTDDLHTLGTAT
jgi:hypothetical protein